MNIFKYSGLKNTKIFFILTITTFFIGVLVVSIFYNFSSNLKNLYLGLKSNYTEDKKYLAVITNNGLWIKDIYNEKILMINIKYQTFSSIFLDSQSSSKSMGCIIKGMNPPSLVTFETIDLAKGNNS